ncbi:MAG: hypothetical protein OEW60_00660 [Thiovulaceae bacterium]|nr:hypothetical protein [Sulfurimonadaceae bacterium]
MEKKQELLELVEKLDDIDDQRKQDIIDKINEWKSDADAESNSLAVTFEKFWLELEPIFAEIGLA